MTKDELLQALMDAYDRALDCDNRIDVSDLTPEQFATLLAELVKVTKSKM